MDTLGFSMQPVSALPFKRHSLPKRDIVRERDGERGEERGKKEQEQAVVLWRHESCVHDSVRRRNSGGMILV